MNTNKEQSTLPMLPLGGAWYWANRRQFLRPGLYWRGHRVLALPGLCPEPFLTDFAERNVIIAKDQPQYRQLPGFRIPNDPLGEIICCWKLPLLCRLKLLWTGKMWHSILSFNMPLQPQSLRHGKPPMPAAPAPAVCEHIEA